MKTPIAESPILPWRGWTPVVVLPIAVLGLTPSIWPHWGLMWVVAVAIYAGCKWLTWRRTPVIGVSWRRHTGYLFAWPGFDAAAFLNPAKPSSHQRPNGRERASASLKLLLGTAVLWVGARRVSSDNELLLGWVGMIGMILILHFGSFHLLSCAWRAAGVDARPLMNAPLASASVSEFWGRRWNTAFRDLTHRFLFRPLAGKLGPRGAIVAGFVFSGLIHELVISVPAGGGYGGPTLFFTIQAAGLLIERSALGQRIGLGRGCRGRLYTMCVLLAPACVLFHPPFVRNVIVPFMKALAAA